MSNSKKTYVPKSAAKNSANNSALAAKKASMQKKKALVVSLVSMLTVIVLTVTLVFAFYTPEVNNEISNKTPSVETDEATLKNGGFNFVTNDVQMSYPYLPLNWKINRTSRVDSVVGSIDTKDDKWANVANDLTNNGITSVSNPGVHPDAVVNKAEDGRILIISNNKKETSTNVITTASLTISSGNYVKITTYIKTVGVSASGAYIGIKTSSSATDYTQQFETIDTNGAWEKYTCYIEGEVNTKSVYLELGLGKDGSPATGTAFFDMASIENITKASYIDNKISKPEKTIVYSFNDERTDNIIENVGNTFASPNATITKRADYVGELPFYDTDENGVDKYITTLTNTSNNPNEVYTDANKTNKYKATISLTEQLKGPSINKAFSISFWMLTSDTTANSGVYVNLVTTQNGKTVSTEQFKAVTSPTDIKDDKFSGWVKYTVLVKASDIVNYDVSLDVFLGLEKYNAEVTTGSVMLTEVETTKLDFDKYSSTSASNTTKKVDVSTLNSEKPTASNLISNPSFDTPISNDNPTNGIFIPSDWSLVLDKGITSLARDAKHGIVNSTSAPAGTTLPTTASPNSLLISAGSTAVSYGYKSKDISLAANGYYVFTVYASGDANVYLTSKSTLDDKTSIDMHLNKKTNGYKYLSYVDQGSTYTQYVFVVATGYTAKTVNLELWLGEKSVGETTKYAAANSSAIFDLATGKSISVDDYKKFYEDDTKEQFAFTRTEVKGNTEDTKLVTDYTIESKFDNVAAIDYSAKDIAPEEEEEEEEEETPEVTPDYEDIDWLLLSSVIVSSLLLLAIVILVVRKIKFFKKSQEKPVSNYKIDK